MQNLETFPAHQLFGQVVWLGKDMDVDVLEILQLGIAGKIFLLAIRGLVQHFHQSRLDHAQFAELVRAQLVQGLGVTFQHDDDPSRAADGIGVFDEPILAFVNGRAWRDAFFA